MITVAPVSNALPTGTGLTTNRPERRSRRDDLDALPTVFRSEWIKLASIRSTQAILGINMVAGFVVSWAVAALVTGEVQYVSDVAFFWSVVTAILATVGGVLLFTSEVQHGTLATALTAQPARWVIAVSKMGIAIVMGLGLGIAGIAAGVGGALITDIGMGDTASMPASTMWALLYTSLSALLGLGIGMIVRHSAGAISVVLVWGLVIENLLGLFIPERHSRFLPFLAGDRMIAIDSSRVNPDAMGGR